MDASICNSGNSWKRHADGGDQAIAGVIRYRQRDAQITRQLYLLPGDADCSRKRGQPRHGSLQFKCIDPREPPTYSVRVGAHYRAVGSLYGGTVIWFWIGMRDLQQVVFLSKTRPGSITRAFSCALKE